MLQAAEHARDFVSGLDRDAFGADRKTQYAVVRALEILGEAASRVSEETRRLHDDIPWRQIVGMRTLLAHEYFRVDVDTVWDVVVSDLPTLVDKLKGIAPREEA